MSQILKFARDISAKRAILKMSDIVNAVAEANELDAVQLLSKRKPNHIAQARYMVYHIAYKRGMTLQHIAELMGREEHSSVLAGVARAAEIRTAYPDGRFALILAELEGKLL